ncbi:hypothetical protein HDU76_009808 [Blyttiomyces sp. JEL0837]|nr:hypothetical protein HDU76_009808 [Blyttiomyces sp. JEL0837]
MKFDPHKAKSSRKWKARHNYTAASSNGSTSASSSATSGEPSSSVSPRPPASSSLASTTTPANSSSQATERTEDFGDDAGGIDVDLETEQLLQRIREAETVQDTSEHFRFKSEKDGLLQEDLLSTRPGKENDGLNLLFLDLNKLEASLKQLPLHVRLGMDKKLLITAEGVPEGDLYSCEGLMLVGDSAKEAAASTNKYLDTWEFESHTPTTRGKSESPKVAGSLSIGTAPSKTPNQSKVSGSWAAVASNPSGGGGGGGVNVEPTGSAKKNSSGSSTQSRQGGGVDQENELDELLNLGSTSDASKTSKIGTASSKKGKQADDLDELLSLASKKTMPAPISSRAKVVKSQEDDDLDALLEMGDSGAGGGGSGTSKVGKKSDMSWLDIVK